MISLRNYQHQAVADLRESYRSGHKRPLLVSPTGSGKTVLFSYMASEARKRDNRVMILAHRAELLEQISNTLRQFSVAHGFIAPGYPGDGRLGVQIASVFALARRIERVAPPDFVIIDEAHHCISGSTWGKIIEAWPNARVLGVTATPARLSGEGLGDIFDDMVLGPSVADLIELGSLSPYRLFAPKPMNLTGVHMRAGDYVRGELAEAVDKPTVTGDAIREYSKRAAGKRACVFCVSVEHAAHVAAQFKASGFPAASIDGGMDRGERKRVLADFMAGRILVLTSCDLISEGFDVPAIEVAILLRPTQSLSLYLQQVGRALRIFEGKSEAIILDHAGNALRHSLPDDERDWSLDGAKKSKRERDPDDIPVKSCPKCYAAVRSIASSCKHCGHVFEVKARVIEHVDGELEEVDKEAIRRQVRIEQAKAKSLDDLLALAKQRGYKPQWAHHIFNARQRA